MCNNVWKGNSTFVTLCATHTRSTVMPSIKCYMHVENVLFFNTVIVVNSYVRTLEFRFAPLPSLLRFLLRRFLAFLSNFTVQLCACVCTHLCVSRCAYAFIRPVHIVGSSSCPMDISDFGIFCYTCHCHKNNVQYSVLTVLVAQLVQRLTCKQVTGSTTATGTKCF